MNQIHHTVFNQERDRAFDHPFSFKEKGTYLVKITAHAKSWWQNTKIGRSFLQKDSLTLRIDSKEIISAFFKKRLRASDIWNGNVLQGHELTAYIVLALDEGNHIFSFDVYGKPYIGEFSVTQISGSDIKVENLKCSPRDRIPWLTFLINEGISLSSLSITAKAPRSGKDDDDLKLLIDGVTEKNTDTKAHRDWYWCGKALRGEAKTFTRSFSDGKTLRRFDLDGDGAPTIQSIIIRIATHSHTRIPTLEDPKWTGDFRDDPDNIILARGIFGEGRSLPELGKIGIGWVIRNRIGYAQWGNTYHEVILKPLQFSAFNKSDPNRIFVEDPSRDSTQREAWRECYRIASSIIQGGISDPTKGANHYYSTYIKPPSWTKGATQTLKIDNTLFYRVPQKAKRAVFPIVFLAFIMIVAGVFASEASRIKSRDLDQESSYFKEYIADNSVAVYYSCGTECMGVRVFDEKTGKQKAEFNYGVGYIWSPDRRRFAAFHSSAGHGFTVGNGKGEVLFIYTKPLENSFDIPNFGQWSPDSSKFAVVIQDSETEYELFVVWGFGGATRVTSVRIPSAQTYVIEWDPTSRFVSVNNDAAILEVDESGYGHRYSEN
ncbi:MAG: cell wall hydrolase [Planctomycetes bacterium]|nr:cell wall hydrolase [Planctomycetota bacterium]